MGIRHKLLQTEETRKKIRTSQIINRIQDHVFKDTAMSATQLKAAEILLRKSIPDLSSVDMSVDHQGNITVQIVRFCDEDKPK